MFKLATSRLRWNTSRQPPTARSREHELQDVHYSSEGGGGHFELILTIPMPLIWLIEDNLPFRRTAQRVLGSRTDLGEVRVFERCEEALIALPIGPPPNIILLDVGLPGMDGIEGIRRFKSIAPEVSILMLTVFETDEKIFRAICAGASGYLLKSAPIATIVDAIDQAMAGGAPMNPRVARRVLEMFAGSTLSQEDYDLSERERTVLELMVKGRVRKQIAEQLELNPHTVDYIMRCIYKKLHVNCVAGAVSVAVRDRLVPPSTPRDRSGQS